MTESIIPIDWMSALPVSLGSSSIPGHDDSVLFSGLCPWAICEEKTMDPADRNIGMDRSIWRRDILTPCVLQDPDWDFANERLRT